MSKAKNTCGFLMTFSITLHSLLTGESFQGYLEPTELVSASTNRFTDF